MSEKELTPHELMLKALKGYITREGLIVGAFTLSLVGVTLYAVTALGQTVKEQVSEEMAPVVRRQESIEVRFEQHLKESNIKRLSDAEFQEQMRQDILSLYKAIITNQKQERLESAAKDGGAR